MSCSIQIRISQEVKDKLDEIKEYPRETYEDIIVKLINNSREEKDGRRK